jgi:4-hydroxyphenylacetate 3-hydroxylase, reductase component
VDEKSMALRRAFGKFATGVAVATSTDPSGAPIGLTINSFSSVSLDPPLVLWSLVTKSPNLDVFRNSSHFAINMLASNQREISDTFARPAEDRFASVDWHRGIANLPVIKGTIATFECRRTMTIEAGDHVVFFGAVEECEQCDLEPLLFFSGKYGTAHVPG